MSRKIPLGIPTLKTNTDIVRRVAEELGLEYEEQPVQGKEEVIRFYFGFLDPELAEKLMSALPYDVYLQMIPESEFLRRVAPPR